LTLHSSAQRGGIAPVTDTGADHPGQGRSEGQNTMLNRRENLQRLAARYRVQLFRQGRRAAHIVQHDPAEHGAADNHNHCLNRGRGHHAGKPGHHHVAQHDGTMSSMVVVLSRPNTGLEILYMASRPVPVQATMATIEDLRATQVRMMLLAVPPKRSS